MSTNPTEQRQPYFNQDFAFSTNYLDYKIPDFRGIINSAVPLLVLPTGILDANFQPLQAKAFHELIRNVLSRQTPIICNDAVLFHRLALEQSGNDEQYRESIWSLTDSHLLWDVCILERRIAWATEGRVIAPPVLDDLLNQYNVPDGSKLRQVLLAQFERLIKGLPLLSNDIAGRRVFREQEYDSAFIPAPKRVRARDEIYYKERLHLFTPLIEGWQKYGPACIGLDVQVAIAERYQCETKYDVAHGSAATYRKHRITLRDRLMEDRLDDCYKTLDQGHEDGSPIYAEEKARKKLHKHWRATTAAEGIEKPQYLRHADGDNDADSDLDSLMRISRQAIRGHTEPSKQRFAEQVRQFPRDHDGHFSLNPAHWGEIIPPAGPLRHWADYHAASQVLHFAETQGANLPRESFPYLKTPAAEYADKVNQPLLAPLPGWRFLVLRIRDLDLLCYLRTHGECEFIYNTDNDVLIPSCEYMAHADGQVDFGELVKDGRDKLASLLDEHDVRDELADGLESFLDDLEALGKTITTLASNVKGLADGAMTAVSELNEHMAAPDVQGGLDAIKAAIKDLGPDMFKPTWDELEVLSHLIGDINTSVLTAPTDWYAHTKYQSPPIDRKYAVPFRCQPHGANYSRICWETSAFYTAYQFFTRPQCDRDRFLAAIFEIGEKDTFLKMLEALNFIGTDWSEEFSHTIARRSIVGFIHGWPAKTIVDQIRDECGDAIPKYLQDNLFSQKIEQLYHILLRRFRFRGLLRPFLFGTLLPKLCIDPMISLDSGPDTSRIILCIDGEWNEDHVVRRYLIDDLMTRDAIDDVTDRKIIQGEATGRQEKERWCHFLAPILEDRYVELGISKMAPGEELFSRLYTTSTISRNGKPGRPVYEIEKPYTCWMETHDDLKKMVAYTLVRAGEKLVAVSDDAFVLEVPEEISPESVQFITNTVRRACENVLGLEAGAWGNFVETELLPTWPAPNFSG